MFELWHNTSPVLLITFALLVIVTAFINVNTVFGFTRSAGTFNPSADVLGCLGGILFLFISLGFALYIGHSSGVIHGAGTPLQKLTVGEPYRVDAVARDAFILTQVSTGREAYFKIRITPTPPQVDDRILIDATGDCHIVRPNQKPVLSP